MIQKKVPTGVCPTCETRAYAIHGASIGRDGQARSASPLTMPLLEGATQRLRRARAEQIRLQNARA